MTRYACIFLKIGQRACARSLPMYFLHLDMGASNARVDWDFAPMLATARDDSVLNVHVLASGVVQARWLRHVDQSMYPGGSTGTVGHEGARNSHGTKQTCAEISPSVHHVSYATQWA